MPISRVCVILVVAALGAGSLASAQVAQGQQSPDESLLAEVAPRRLPVRVVGTGSPASCTSAKVVAAVAAGGKVVFDCGPDPVTIKMRRTAKVVNTNRKTVVNGGGRITLSGVGKRRILYQNTCDSAQASTTTHCDDQRFPALVVRNIRLRRGNSSGSRIDGGGAIFVRGGQLRVINSSFARNRCDSTGPDVGGAAIRVLSHWTGKRALIRGSVFRRGRCANGSALSSIGVSWRVLDSVFKNNRAIGVGANPARPGTPGGG
ncbi:MAG: hypothetical protein ACRCYU_16605, partial [Nocardioides sp.]